MRVIPCFLLMAASCAAPAAAEVLLIGAGDIAKCGPRLENAEATARLLDDLFLAPGGGRRAGGVFTLGDNVYPRGRATEFARCYEPTWGRHKARTRPAVGNHEYRSSGAVPYFEYFGAAAGEAGKGYYSYDIGQWHVVVLNTDCAHAGGCGPGSAQHRWLRDDLAAHPRPCTVAYGHHPRFSSGKHGAKKSMFPVFETLYEHGVELLLSGHDHHYERFAPQDPNGRLDPQRGVRQFIVGTGGRGHRRLRKRRPHSEAADDTSFGVLKLTLGSSSYEWEFVPITGDRFRDSGRGVCH